MDSEFFNEIGKLDIVQLNDLDNKISYMELIEFGGVGEGLSDQALLKVLDGPSG